jgi:hypothetical protein
MESPALTGITTDAYAFVDSRFDLLKKRAQLADADHARGKVERLWLVCMQRGTDVLEPLEVAAVVNVAALVESKLGELVPDGVRIRGVRSRLDAAAEREAALERQRQAGREGGKKGGRPRKKPPDGEGQPLSETRRVSGGGKGGVYLELSPDVDLSTHQGSVEGGVGGDPSRTPGVSIHQTFVETFTALFAAANEGARPSWGGKNGALVRSILLAHGLDESLRRARIMFTAPPPWPPPPHDLGTLVRHFDRFAQPYVEPKANGANGHRHAADPNVQDWGRTTGEWPGGTGGAA